MEFKIRTIILLIGIGLILGSLLIIYYEVKPAKDFCKSINGTYIYSKLTHRCNDIEINKYISEIQGVYWGFKPVGNYSITIPTK